MERKISIILMKKSRWKQHLIYVIDDKIVVDTVKNTILIYEKKKGTNVIQNLRYKNFKGYKMAGWKIVYQDVGNVYSFMRPFLFNCISVGKILLGMKGIYFSCEKFFDKIKR